MAQATAYDVTQLTGKLDLPYNLIEGALSNKPRLTAGSNTYVTFGSTLDKRPGTTLVSSSAFGTTTPRIDRVTVVESMDNPPLIYILASVYNGTNYSMYYMRVDGPTTWTQFPAVRDCNASLYPHEIVVFNGRAYIKSFGTTDKYGSIVFDPNGGSPVVRHWGDFTVPTPAGLSNPSGWPASANPITVGFGWKYIYAFESATGNIGPCSTLQTNPSLNPSVSGAFSNKIPQVTVTGRADTTNYPFIRIYRSTDGGGTFMQVGRIANPGATTSVFQDNQRASGAGSNVFQDPIRDSDLSTTNQAPDFNSNFGPPSVAPPKVIGTDTVQQSTRLVVYSRRIWFAIGTYLFYSGDEEIIAGNPEENFPVGTRGNFYRMPEQVTNLIATPSALLVFTTKHTYRVIGSTKDSFIIKPLFFNIGAAKGHNQAAAANGEKVYWLTQDLRVVGSDGNDVVNLSAELGADLSTAISTGAEVELAVWAEQEKEWLIVAAHNRANPSLSKQWICDLAQSRINQAAFWFTPWTIPSTAMYSGQIRESVPNRRLTFAMKVSNIGQLGYFDTTSKSDNGLAYGYSFRTNLFSVATGDHVSSVNAPERTPEVNKLSLERTKFAGDTDPTVYFYVDDIGNKAQATLSAETPLRRQPSEGYVTALYNIVRVAQRCAVEIRDTAKPMAAQFHSLAIHWGTGEGD